MVHLSQFYSYLPFDYQQVNLRYVSFFLRIFALLKFIIFELFLVFDYFPNNYLLHFFMNLLDDLKVNNNY